MGDLAQIFIVFLVLYLFESLAFVPRRSVGFHKLLGRWRARLAFRPNASWRSSVVPGIPWPPLSPPWIADELTLSLDPDGVTVPGDPAETLPWEDLRGVVADGTKVTLDGRVLSTHTSRSGAARLAEILVSVGKKPKKQRPEAIQRFFDERFDVAAATARRLACLRSTRVLRVLSNGLWVTLFGGLGVAVFTQNFLILLGAAFLSLPLWVAVSIAFHRALKKSTWLEKDQWPDFGKRLVAILSPLSGVRAADLLAREVFTILDPVAVAASLLAKDDLARFARPRLVALDPKDGDGPAYFRDETRARMEKVLRAAGVDLETLRMPPAKEGDHAETYCPACHAQYEAGRAPGSPCPGDDCVDIPLRAFGDGKKPAKDRPS